MQDRIRSLKVVWVGMVAGTVAYTGVVYFLMSAAVVDVGAFGPEVMNLVGGVVILQLVASLMLRRRMLAAIPDGVPAEERVGRYATVSIVALALLEAGGLFVITFALVSGAATWVLAGGGASVVLMLIARPSAEELGG